MLTKPEYGWTELTIGGWTIPCAYTTDVPVDLLHSVELVMYTKEPAVIQTRRDQLRDLTVLQVDGIHLLRERKDNSYLHLEVGVPIADFARALISDIRAYIDDWVVWPVVADSPGFDREERKDTLLTFCLAIEALLPKYLS